MLPICLGQPIDLLFVFFLLCFPLVINNAALNKNTMADKRVASSYPNYRWPAQIFIVWHILIIAPYRVYANNND